MKFEDTLLLKVCAHHLSLFRCESAKLTKDQAVEVFKPDKVDTPTKNRPITVVEYFLLKYKAPCWFSLQSLSWVAIRSELLALRLYI